MSYKVAIDIEMHGRDVYVVSDDKLWKLGQVDKLGPALWIQWIGEQRKRWRRDAYTNLSPWHDWCDAKAKAWWSQKAVSRTYATHQRRGQPRRAVVNSWGEVCVRLKARWHDALRYSKRGGWNEWARKRSNSWRYTERSRAAKYAD